MNPKQIAVIILTALLIATAGIGIFLFLQNNKLSQDNQSLQSQIQGFQSKESDLLAKAKKLEKDQQELNDKIRQKEKEREESQHAYDGLKSKVDELNSQIASANQDRDDYKGRVDTMRKERDDLMEKVRNQKEKIVEKIVEKPVEKIVYRDRPASGATETDDQAKSGSVAASPENASADVSEQKGDQYWANVLKEKESLKLDLQKAQSELDQSALQVVELKKQNSDIQIQLKNLTDLKEDLEKKLSRDKEDLEIQIANEKKEFDRKIKYSEDLANSLSMEVARAHSDQKDSVERAEKYKQDSMALQDQIKQLSTTKLALERTIAAMNTDKVSMQKRLDQTEGAIQGRIDEIWKIKQNLDQKISQLPSTNNSPNSKASSAEVELPPIVVNPSAGSGFNETPKTQQPEKRSASPSRSAANTVAAPSKDQGTIISINEPNNFVIVDLGEGDASQVGRKLTVYRDNNPVGSLEVIQVRKDISAADIKESNGALRVGDTVRYN